MPAVTQRAIEIDQDPTISISHSRRGYGPELDQSSMAQLEADYDQPAAKIVHAKDDAESRDIVLDGGLGQEELPHPIYPGGPHQTAAASR